MSPSPSATVLHSACPAKLNLHLSVTGKRADGFHNLVSVVAKIDLCDELELHWTPQSHDGDRLECDDPTLPTDGHNLVLRAAQRMRQEAGFPAGGQLLFKLRKRIPHGAGLGGGSSDAAAALRLLNTLRVQPLAAHELAGLAAELGSDCPLFLHPGMLVMRGRGEQLSPVSNETAARLRGRECLLFKPDFPISTPWAYGELAARQAYDDAAQAEARIADWAAGRIPLEALLHNTFHRAVSDKFPTLPILWAELEALPGLRVLMSGSGSACFASLPDPVIATQAEALIHEAWGEDAFCQRVRLL